MAGIKECREIVGRLRVLGCPHSIIIDIEEWIDTRELLQQQDTRGPVVHFAGTNIPVDSIVWR